MSFTSEEEQWQNILTEMVLTAYQDGVITEEEKAILAELQKELKNYENKNTELNLNLNQEETDSDFKKRVLKNIYEVSSKDFNISRDERALINKLIKMLIPRKN